MNQYLKLGSEMKPYLWLKNYLAIVSDTETKMILFVLLSTLAKHSLDYLYSSSVNFAEYTTSVYNNLALSSIDSVVWQNTFIWLLTASTVGYAFVTMCRTIKIKLLFQGQETIYNRLNNYATYPITHCDLSKCTSNELFNVDEFKLAQDLALIVVNCYFNLVLTFLIYILTDEIDNYNAVLMIVQTLAILVIKDVLLKKFK